VRQLTRGFLERGRPCGRSRSLTLEAFVTTLLDHIEVPPTTRPPSITPARRLRATMAAGRVQFTWFGIQKALTPGQKARAADAFDADAPFLSAGKKLLDSRHLAFRAVTAVRGQIDAYWEGRSLPFPEPSLRLIRQDGIADFDRQLADDRVELDAAVAELDRRSGELLKFARDCVTRSVTVADSPRRRIDPATILLSQENACPAPGRSRPRPATRRRSPGGWCGCPLGATRPSSATSRGPSPRRRGDIPCGPTPPDCSPGPTPPGEP
jgi:hypothetical protein